MDEDDIGGTVAESSESLAVSLEEALLLLGIPNNHTGWDGDG